MSSPDPLTVEPRTPADRPLRADAERNRQRLLVAAEEVFAERGLDATLDDIAARAGVGIGTAYRRFANKQEVIQELFELRVNDIVELARRCSAMPDAGEGLVLFIQETCAAMTADRGFRDVLLHGYGAENKIAVFRERLIPILTGLVERAQARGVVRSDFSAHDLPIVMLMMEAVADATDRLDPQLWRRYLAIVLDGLRDGRTSPRPLPGRPLRPDQIEQAMANRHLRN